MRKSPSAHEVEHHSRTTPKTHRKVSVRTYKRGEGKPETPELFSRRKAVDDTSHGGFDIRIKYADGGTVSGVVKGTEYRETIARGLGLAHETVRSITMRKMEPWTREVT